MMSEEPTFVPDSSGGNAPTVVAGSVPASGDAVGEQEPDPISLHFHTETGIARNCKCHCGSGLKYKRCCLVKERSEIKRQDEDFKRRLGERWKAQQDNPTQRSITTVGAALMLGALMGQRLSKPQ